MSESVSLVDYGLIKVQGADAKKFLQGQLTCNVDIIDENSGTLAAHCNPQGRIISLFHLFLLQGNYYLFLPRTMVPIAIAGLKKYIPFFKAEMLDVSNELFIIGLLSKEKPTFANTFCLPITAERYLLVSSEKSHLPTLPTSSHPWQFFDIQSGIPAIYPETTATFLPHELNLIALNAISFDKGCYTGQEIIARMHYRGKLKTHLYKGLINSDTNILPGTDVCFKEGTTPQITGKIVAACATKDNNKHDILLTAAEADITKQLFLENNAGKVISLARI